MIIWQNFNLSLLFIFYLSYQLNFLFCLFLLSFRFSIFYPFYLVCQLIIYTYFPVLVIVLGFIIQIFITQYIFKSFKIIYFHFFSPDLHASIIIYFIFIYVISPSRTFLFFLKLSSFEEMENMKVFHACPCCYHFQRFSFLRIDPYFHLWFCFCLKNSLKHFLQGQPAKNEYLHFLHV